MPGTTMMIGLDGATFTILEPLMQRGLMPVLQGLMKGGASATLRSIMPPLTPPGWTSLITGKRPGQHGVFDFFQKSAADSRVFGLATSHDMHSETVWSLASHAGRRVLVLNYPVTFPPPDVNGCVVPGGWMPWRQLRLGCRPAGLFDRLKTLPSFDPREMALDMKLEERAVEGCANDEYGEWTALHARRERRWLDVARFLMREAHADLVTIVFDGVDKLQHLCWRFLDPAYSNRLEQDWEVKTKYQCEMYFQQLDEILGELVDLAGPDATTVIASDHGFGPGSEIIHLNTWLEQHGLLRWADDAAPADAEGSQVGFDRIAQHLQALDWEHTLAYVGTPSAQGIHIVRRGPNGEERLDERQYRSVRDEIVARLKEAKHPNTGRPLIAEVWTREEAFAGPYAELGPDVSVIPQDGAAVSIVRSDAVVKNAADVGGSHRWEGVFIANGPGIQAGVSLPELSITDVAPLLLYSMDLPIPNDLSGTLRTDVLEPDWLASHPRRQALDDGALEVATLDRVDLGFDPEDEAIIVDRLKALGYVE